MTEIILTENIKKRGRPRKNDPEQKKTYMRIYMKDYYEKNKEIQQSQKKNYYYKNRKDMPKEYIDKFGAYASSLYKIHRLMDNIKKHKPELLAEIKEY